MSERVSDALALVLGVDSSRREVFDVVCSSGLVWSIRVPAQYSPGVTVKAIRFAAERAEMAEAIAKTAAERELSAALVIAEAKHHPDEYRRLAADKVAIDVAIACETVIGTKGRAPEGLAPGLYRAGTVPSLDSQMSYPVVMADGVADHLANPPVIDARSFAGDASEVAAAAQEVEGIASRLRHFRRP